jgi:hypothetical protein
VFFRKSLIFVPSFFPSKFTHLNSAFFRKSLISVPSFLPNEFTHLNTVFFSKSLIFVPSFLPSEFTHLNSAFLIRAQALRLLQCSMFFFTLFFVFLWRVMSSMVPSMLNVFINYSLHFVNSLELGAILHCPAMLYL